MFVTFLVLSKTISPNDHFVLTLSKYVINIWSKKSIFCKKNLCLHLSIGREATLSIFAIVFLIWL